MANFQKTCDALLNTKSIEDYLLDGPMDDVAKEFIRNDAEKFIDSLLNMFEAASLDSEKKAELLKELLINCDCLLREEQVHRKRAETELDNLIGYFKKAWAEYNSPDHNRWEQRAKAFCSCLGLTSGKRNEKTNKKWLYCEYVGLVHGELDMDTFEKKKPMGRWEALEELAKRHNLASAESVLEQIRVHVREKSKEDPVYCSPGLLPGRKPSDLK
jgi:DNA-binding ferritin-like protein (Dps family)